MKKPCGLYSIPLHWGNYAKPSAQMIRTLKSCVDIENRYPGKPYGPADIKGSFAGLYKRGLLDIQGRVRERSGKTTWYVTNEGLHYLLSIY